MRRLPEHFTVKWQAGVLRRHDRRLSAIRQSPAGETTSRRAGLTTFRMRLQRSEGPRSKAVAAAVSQIRRSEVQGPRSKGRAAMALRLCEQENSVVRTNPVLRDPRTSDLGPPT